jgi:hypothetical protein
VLRFYRQSLLKPYIAWCARAEQALGTVQTRSVLQQLKLLRHRFRRTGAYLGSAA